MAKYKYKKLEADRILWEELRKMFGNLPCNVRFEHKDASGYWYTFELANDPRRQTIQVNPSKEGGTENEYRYHVAAIR